MSVKRNRKYHVGTLDKGLDVLERLEKSAHPLSIKDLSDSTGIERTGVYRLVSTLEHRGYITRGPDRRYASMQWRRKVTIAYLAPLDGTPLRRELLAGIQSSSARPHVQLLTMDNAVDDVEGVEKNLARLARESADVAVIFQPHAPIAHLLASRLAAMGMPHITICSPVEGVVYLGPNNYYCGKQAGHALGVYILTHWAGRADFVGVMEPAQMASDSMARVSGTEHGYTEVLKGRCKFRALHTVSREYREESRQLIGRLIAELAPKSRIALACFNDPTALGALDAARASGCESRIAVVSHCGTHEARVELLRPGSGLIASVGYFPEGWGEGIVRLAVAVANKQPVEPAMTVQSVVLTRDNVTRHYPDLGSF